VLQTTKQVLEEGEGNSGMEKSLLEVILRRLPLLRRETRRVAFASTNRNLQIQVQQTIRQVRQEGQGRTGIPESLQEVILP
jgi:hypothetical protein